MVPCQHTWFPRYDAITCEHVADTCALCGTRKPVKLTFEEWWGKQEESVFHTRFTKIFASKIWEAGQENK